MNFNTEEVKVNAQLKGNEIHTVTFDGIEAADYKDGEFQVMKIKFSNENGTFTHTVFPLRDGDDKDTEGMYGKQPSNLIAMMTLLRHLGNAVSPQLVALCNNKEVLNNLTWPQFRKKVIEAVADGVGKETKIKLLSRTRTDSNTGETVSEATFPSYFVSYTRDGRLYMRTSFIGNGIYFSDKELTRIKNSEKKPTSVSKENDILEDDSSSTSDFDLDI